MQITKDRQRFCGREFTAENVSVIQEVVETCAGLSRLELAHTVSSALSSTFGMLAGRFTLHPVRSWKTGSGIASLKSCEERPAW
jgi:hypothetical protein